MSGRAGGIGSGAGVVASVPKLQTLDNEGAGVLVVGPDGDGLVVVGVDPDPVSVPLEGDGQISSQDLARYG